MSPVAPRLRRWLHLVRRTPFHPQWLLGGNATTGKWILRYAQGQVIDVGCADRLAATCLPAGSDYLALDYPSTGGDLYNARPDVFADASRLPLADASVGTVLLLEVLEHLRFPAEALAEISRVLRPGGKLLLTIPFLYPVHDAPHDYQRYTSHGLVRELEAAGLKAEAPLPSVGSAESEGLLLNLALGGMASEALAGRRASILMLPLLAVAVPLVNTVCWLLVKMMPDWSAMTAGYRVLAIRP